MRINVYQEELTNNIELIEKKDVIGEDGLPVTFVGIRVWLKGSEDLHNTEFDNDSPAVTFWSRDWRDLRNLGINIMETSCGMRN